MNDRDTIWIGEWRLDPGVRSLSREGVEHRLEPKMVDVLLLLVARAGQPVPRRELERSVWSGAAVGTELLNRTVWKLRKVLGDDPARPTYIETIPRVGYRLVAQVRRMPPHEGTSSVARARRVSGAWRVGIALAATASAVVGWVLFGSGDPTPATTPPVRVVPLTATPGYEAAPALSPDGRFVAYQRYEPQAPEPTWDIALMDLGSGAARVLDGPPAAHEYAPAWSPDGDSIVFVRERPEACEILVQARDGEPMRAATCALDQSHEVAWAPDGSFILASARRGQTLGLTRLDRNGRSVVQLTSPPVGFDGDRRPRVSPDGAGVAFVRERTEGIGDIYLAELGGSSEPVRLTFDNRTIGGLAWASDGAGLIFSSNRGGDSQLWRIALDGSGPFPVPMTGRNASTVTVAADVTVYEEYFGDSDLWVLEPGARAPAPWTGSSRSEWGGAVCPDGTRIAFLSDRSGSAEIWLASLADGVPTRITELDGARVDPPRWSPDGTSLIFAAAREGNFDVYTVSASGGEPRRITHSPEDERAPVWWDDEVVYAANRTGAYELWALTPGAGPARRLTSGGGFAARPPEHGDEVYFTRTDEPGLWSLGRSGRRPELVWADVHPDDWANWTPTSEGIVLFRVHGTPSPRIERFDRANGRVDTLGVMEAEAPDRAGITRAPDGRIFFSRVVRSESDLWIARGGGKQ